MAITELHARQLVAAHQSGDRRAFDEIARLAYPSLYHHARRRLIDHHAAEDAVQETFVRAYRALPRFEGDFRLQAWLHRILTNVCADEGYRRSRDTSLAERVGTLAEAGAPDPADLTARAETRASVANAVAELPDAYRDAVVLRYRDDLSYRAVADATGVSEENARARASRGRAALQRVLRSTLGWVLLALPAVRRARRSAPAADPAVTAPVSPLVEPIGHVAASGHLSAPLTNLSTNLAAHAVQAAPTVTRLVEVASMGEARTGVVANVVGAVAAVVVPAAAYTVLEPTPPPPAVVEADVAADSLDWVATSVTTALAAPLTSMLVASSTTLPLADLTSSTVRSTSSTTASSTPPAAPVTSTPLATDGAGADGSDAGGVENPPASRRGALVSDSLEVRVSGSEIDLRGPVGFATFEKGREPQQGRVGHLSGELELDGAGSDGARRVRGDLEVTLEGRTHVLRLDGRLVEERTVDAGTTYRFLGSFQLDGAHHLGLPERGEAAWTVLATAEGPSSLRLSLGDQPKPVEGNAE